MLLRFVRPKDCLFQRIYFIFKIKIWKNEEKTNILEARSIACLHVANAPII